MRRQKASIAVGNTATSLLLRALLWVSVGGWCVSAFSSPPFRTVVGTATTTTTTKAMSAPEFDDGGIDDAALLSIDLDGVVGSTTKTTPSNPYATTSTPPSNPYARSSTKRPAKASADRSSPRKRAAAPFGANAPFRSGSRASYGDYYDTTAADDVVNTDAAPPPPAETTNIAAATPPSNDTNTPAPTTTPEQHAALAHTLSRYYGFSEFREGQSDVIAALTFSRRDCAVFWATGSGKSLCYQLPALHRADQTSFVVSPLISLMQDQCDRLNGSVSPNSAVYLGSAQPDPDARRRALAGEHRVVYVTPESLLANDSSFLDELSSSALVRRGGVALLAVDEAHCVSEWGNDFRPDYRRLGEALARCPGLAAIPRLVLTATATPRVRRDIVESLRLRDPAVFVSSFDRENLRLSVRRRPASFAVALAPLVDTLEKESRATVVGGSSTVIYVPTKARVDEVARWMSDRLSKASVRVVPYHAGLSHADRERHHTDFLVGKATVVVATVAFGMGIDKPDTRRVYHYGPPKTTEEYFQQIGRAGRDGLPAECVMWCDDADFSRYSGDFYTKNLLTETTRENARRSTEALRRYAMDTETCRRAALLRYFRETPPFGERCGTCDNCVDHQKRGGVDARRDFRHDGALVLLTAIRALRSPSATVLLQVVAGKTVEDYRWRRDLHPATARRFVEEARIKMTHNRPQAHYKELLPALVTKGYVDLSVKKTTAPGTTYQTSWSAYDVTPKGERSIKDDDVPVELPVPPSLRKLEEDRERKRLAALAALEQAGVDLAKIPAAELETGDGEVLRAHKHWASRLDLLERTGRTEQKRRLEDLRARVEAWRREMAEEFRMAPAAVLPDHAVLRVAYASASSPAPVAAEALAGVGVRSAGLARLVDALNAWRDEGELVDDDDSRGRRRLMVFPSGDRAFAPARPWPLAVYKPNKKTGLAVWESSHSRFVNDGENLQNIAMNPRNGRPPIQVNTVASHVLTALTHGRPAPLKRLAEESGGIDRLPDRDEWERLRAAEETYDGGGGDDGVCGTPSVSLTDFLRPIMGDAFADAPREERTEEEQAEFVKWCYKSNWYMALRRAGYEPTFAEEEDEAAVAKQEGV